ncbi:MAG: LCP family protein [Oscillospiraceae bacterium]
MQDDKTLGLRYFVSALAISFLGLILFLSFVLLKNPPIILNNTQNELVTKNIYLPSSEEKLSIFLTISKEKNSSPYLCALIYFDPIGGKIPVVTFSPKCKLIVEGKNETLNSIFNKSGISVVKNGFENYANIKIDRYISTTSEVITNIIDLSRKIDIDFPDKIKVSENFSINKGLQTLDGTTAAKVLETICENVQSPSFNPLPSTILSQLLNNLLPLVGSPKGERIFNQIVNNSATDISYKDYEMRIRACKFMNTLASKASYPLILQGKLNDAENTFTFTANSLSQLKLIFEDN